MRTRARAGVFVSRNLDDPIALAPRPDVLDPRVAQGRPGLLPGPWRGRGRRGAGRRRLGLGPVTPDQRCLQLLGGYAWPGNVRELENIISRATLRAAADFKRGEEVVLSPEHLGSGLAEGISPQRTDPAPEASPVDSQPLRQATEDFQREMIRRAVERTDGNWAAAARELGLHRSNLHHLAGRLGLK